jgi:predicted ABC-type ATPase
MGKKILMIAGPNGAGKTTMTADLLSHSASLYEFINADEIAKGLAPKNPESVALSASKLMIERLRELLANDKNFAFETTASGTNYVRYLQEAKSKGYEINLCFLWLASAEQAVKRVAQRVAQGGHNILKETIIRRYSSGLSNLLNIYLPIADKALIIDNSTEGATNKFIARKFLNDDIQVFDQQIWQKIVRVADGKR